MYDEIIRPNCVYVLRLAAHTHNDLKPGLFYMLFMFPDKIRPGDIF